MNWSLNNLAPICPVPHCPKYGTRHLLDHQKEVATQILTGEETYIYWQAGVGSAKTLLWGVLAAAYMIMIPGCDIILCRKDFALLYDTLWKYFKNSLQAAIDQHIINDNFKKIFTKKTQGDHSICQLSNGSIARAVQLKNFSEAMGPNRDAIFISDAMENENFGFIFHGEGTVGGLQSRLRGQRASFFPTGNGHYKDLRRFLIESNPPPNINELHTIFGKEPGVRNLTHIADPVTNRFITYRHIQTTTTQNNHNPASYVAEIAAMHDDPGDIARILGGQSIAYYGGIKVIKTFKPEHHVMDVESDANLPLYVGIDPGLQHPAVLFGQIKECAFGRNHFLALSEISNFYDKTIYNLVEYDEGPFLGILAHLRLFYPEHFQYYQYEKVRHELLGISHDERIDHSLLEQFFSQIHFCIDKSGDKRTPLTRDKESERIILLTKFGIRCRMRTNIGLHLSLTRVTQAFDRICTCNLPELIISKNCELLIDAYSGGYRYKKNKDGTRSEDPIDDHRYEDIADAHRYTLENFFFTNHLSLSDEERFYPLNEPPYQWMLHKDRL